MKNTIIVSLLLSMCGLLSCAPDDSPVTRDPAEKPKIQLSAYNGSVLEFSQFAIHNLIEIKRIVNFGMSQQPEEALAKLYASNNYDPFKRNKKSICQELELVQKNENYLELRVHSFECKPLSSQRNSTKYNATERYKISYNPEGYLQKLEYTNKNSVVSLKARSKRSRLTASSETKFFETKTLTINLVGDDKEMSTSRMYSLEYDLKVKLIDQYLRDDSFFTYDHPLNGGDNLSLHIEGLVGLKDELRIFQNTMVDMTYATKRDVHLISRGSRGAPLFKNEQNMLILKLRQGLKIVDELEDGSKEKEHVPTPLYVDPHCGMPSGSLALESFVNLNDERNQFYNDLDVFFSDKYIPVCDAEEPSFMCALPMSHFANERLLCTKKDRNLNGVRIDNYTINQLPYDLVFMR